MYSYEQRLKAVELLIKYDMSYAAVIRELGYPNSRSLRRWYYEYRDKGNLSKEFPIREQFSPDQKQAAVDYYLQHGKNLSRTCRILGYPHRETLDKWLRELAPEEKKLCRASRPGVRYTQDYKEQAVIALCSREKTAKEVAADYGTTRENLYNWHNQLLIKEPTVEMKLSKARAKKKDKENLKANNAEVDELQSSVLALTQERDDLKKEVHRLKIERDIYEKAAEIIKKDEGISIESLSNREKVIVINALRKTYSLAELLGVMQMAKSSYCYQAAAIRYDKYQEVRVQVRESFEASGHSYGYRRIHAELRAWGVVLSEKVVRRIMKDEKLIVPIVRHSKYNSYKGEITPAVDNVINRDFHSEKPNEKWLTDITEFGIPAGKVYLSPIIDCYDGMPVTWTIGTSPNADLVNTMLDDAIETLQDDEKPIVHSDRGSHYRWQGWIERMEQHGLIRSMSKKGCSPDNSACEGFFGRLKNEMFYGRSWKNVSIEQFIHEVNKYLCWYKDKRIKLSLGGLSPIQYRKSLGLSVPRISVDEC